MSKIDVTYINLKAFQKKERLFTEEDLSYDEIKHDGSYLLDKNGNRIGTKGDFYNKLIIEKILTEGCWDEYPRPHYKDGAAAHSISLNNAINWTYDISKGESPLITVRPISIDSSIGEILWIYQDQSTNLDLLRDKYNITWWDEWDLLDKNGNPKRDIGSTYGSIIKNYNQMSKLLKEIKNNPDSRRHIIDMWQLEDFIFPHGLKPCAYSTVWNVRHERDGIDYLDMKLLQRSSDYLVAGTINQMQYVALMEMVARSTDLEPGRFTWDVQNVHIYDRHISQAIEELRREPVNCEPKLVLNDKVKDFYKIKKDDFKVEGYPKKLIKEKNPQIKFDLGI